MPTSVEPTSERTPTSATSFTPGLRSQRPTGLVRAFLRWPCSMMPDHDAACIKAMRWLTDLCKKLWDTRMEPLPSVKTALERRIIGTVSSLLWYIIGRVAVTFRFLYRSFFRFLRRNLAQISLFLCSCLFCLGDSGSKKTVSTLAERSGCFIL